MTKPGFSLFELLVYCFLLSILVLLIFTWVNKAQSSLGKANSGLARTIADHVALDVLVRDLHQAPAQHELWETVSKNSIVWYADRESVGWQQEEGALFRYTGTRRDGRWVTCTKSLMHDNVRDIAFNLVTKTYQTEDATNTQVREVQCTLNRCTITVALRNRRVGYNAP